MTRGTATRSPNHARIPAKIDLVQPTGSRTFITFNAGSTAVVAEVAAHDVQRPGEQIDLDIDMLRSILIDPASGAVLGAEKA